MGIRRGVLPSPAAGPLGSSPGERGGGPPATSILGVQLHSAGPGRPQARDLRPVGAAAAQMVPEGRKGIHPAGCRLPVCDTHYRNDCVFSLITHYFYAERRLNEGKKKNNSNNTSREQLTHTQNTLLFVWNSTVCKRRPVNIPLHSVSHVCVVAPSSEILSHLAVVLFSGLFVTEEEHAARLPLRGPPAPPAAPPGWRLGPQLVLAQSQESQTTFFFS